MKFECYIARFEGVVLYVGQGRAGRHNHCNSGTSHVFNLNKVFFNFGEMDVEVIPQANRESAIEQESALIDRLKPVFNKVGACYNRMSDRDMTFDKFIDELTTDSENSDVPLHRVIVENRELGSSLEDKTAQISDLQNQLDLLRHDLDRLQGAADTAASVYHEQLISSVNLNDEPVSKRVLFLKLRDSGFTQRECVKILGKSLATIKRWEKKHRGRKNEQN